MKVELPSRQKLLRAIYDVVHSKIYNIYWHIGKNEPDRIEWYQQGNDKGRVKILIFHQ